MVIQQNVAYGIVRGLAEFWKCEELQDFTVTLGTVHFQCHRLLLAACSDFFRGLFRSGMQETERKCVTIEDISSETFELILETLYTGHGVLTKDNVISIWRAAHQLQIHFLISECESLVLETLSMDNYAEYFYTSNMLNSAVVLKTVWPFVLKNCNSFFETRFFFQLQCADVLSLIKCQDIETDCEDDVIHAILKWAEFQDNQSQFSMASTDGMVYKIDTDQENESSSGEEPGRKKCKTYKDILTASSSLGNNVQMESCDDRDIKGDITNKDVSCRNLTILLSHARTCLASQRCLEMLTKHPLVKDNKEAKDIVIEALLYKLQVGKRNGHWPSRAVHRNNSKFIHCMTTANKVGNNLEIRAFSLASKQWCRIASLYNISTYKLATIDNELCALYIRSNGSDLSDKHKQNIVVDRPTSSSSKELFLFWLKNDICLYKRICLTLTSDDFHVAVVDYSMYIFSAHNQTVWQFDPTAQLVTRVSSLSQPRTIAYVMPYDQSIFVFYASPVEGIDETVITCYDTSENTWTHLNNLEGPANGMSSFKDNHFMYILQSNGNLWKNAQTQTNIKDFEFLVKLWDCSWTLLGAVTFLDDLHIFGVRLEGLQNDIHFMKSLPGVFREIIYHEITSVDNSMVNPILLSKTEFSRNLIPGYIVKTVQAPCTVQ